MQSFSDYEFCGVVVRDGGGGGEGERGRGGEGERGREGEGETKSPQVKKKEKRF